MKPLTLQQAREFIAEKAGWCGFIEVNESRIIAAPPGETLREDVPDYFNPTNREALYWMHLAEKALNETQWHTYNAHLNHLTLRERLFATVSATAPQRARAFCQVFGFSVEGEG